MIREARCQKCGETFNPHTDDDLEHFAREDETVCGGRGVLLGGWLQSEEERVALRKAETRALTALTDEACERLLATMTGDEIADLTEEQMIALAEQIGEEVVPRGAWLQSDRLGTVWIPEQ